MRKYYNEVIRPAKIERNNGQMLKKGRPKKYKDIANEEEYRKLFNERERLRKKEERAEKPKKLVVVRKLLLIRMNITGGIIMRKLEIKLMLRGLKKIDHL
ncbi:MAG: hypothetical protein ACKPKO_29050 [Candidatus Fonsibacter sp.]